MMHQGPHMTEIATATFHAAPCCGQRATALPRTERMVAARHAGTAACRLHELLCSCASLAWSAMTQQHVRACKNGSMKPHLVEELIPHFDAQAVIQQGPQQPAVVHQRLQRVVLQDSGAGGTGRETGSLDREQSSCTTAPGERRASGGHWRRQRQRRQCRADAGAILRLHNASGLLPDCAWHAHWAQGSGRARPDCQRAGRAPCPGLTSVSSVDPASHLRNVKVSLMLSHRALGGTPAPTAACHKLPAAASGDVCGASGSRTKGRGTPQAPTPSHAWTAWRVIAAAICAPFDIGSDARRDGNAACRACATRSPCASRARCRGNQGPRLVYSSATRVCSSTTHVAISNTGPAASPPTSPSGAACRRSAACR